MCWNVTLAVLPPLLKALSMWLSTDHVAVRGCSYLHCTVVMGFHQLATVYVTLSLVCAASPFGGGDLYP